MPKAVRPHRAACPRPSARRSPLPQAPLLLWLRTGGQEGGWGAAAGIRLPKNTDFLVIQLLAAENVFNDLNGVEFDGHYADSTFVTLVRDPPAKFAT